MTIPSSLPDDELWRLIREDAPYGDLTTHSLGIGERKATISFSARRTMRLAGTEEAARMMELCGAQIDAIVPTGTELAANACFLQARGSAAALCLAWKTAQVLVESYSGMATRAAAMVQAVRSVGSDAAIACTRKNLPGTRAPSVKAICAAGMIAHRLGLSETILVTPEHQRFISEDARVWLGQLARCCPEKRIVAEVLTHERGMELALAGADVIQLEKFSPAAAARFVAAVREQAAQVKIAAAGGIDEHNIADYAKTGVDILVSSAPYSAPPADAVVVLRPQ